LNLPVQNLKGRMERFQIVIQRGGEERRMNRIFPTVYSLAFAANEDDFKRVAAAEVRIVVPRSFTLAATIGNRSQSRENTSEAGSKRKRRGKDPRKVKTYQR